ncbi:hypothetical protein [Natronomonas sp.]|uniref:hypothetical protein n=1 Tax=Natronomonas sp. TaxID=2184060 RepID=UPI003976EDC7
MPVEHDAFRESITATRLPDRVSELAADYDRRIGIRDDFVWRWIYSLLPSFRIPTVPKRHEPTVREQKTLLTIFITVLDDIAEHDGDKTTFEQARNIPFPHQTVETGRSDVDAETIEFARRVWRQFEAPLRSAPRGEEFAEILGYDVRQAINAMDYSRLVGEHPAMANLANAYRYGAHNMIMYPYADVDLMYSPDFDRTDLSILRETLGELQRLARIGNWLTTWRRELEEGDYSSGILVAALQDGLIDPTGLAHRPTPEQAARYVETIEENDVEARFYAEWSERFSALERRVPAAESVDIGAIVDGMRTVFDYHRNSEGLK